MVQRKEETRPNAATSERAKPEAGTGQAATSIKNDTTSGAGRQTPLRPGNQLFLLRSAYHATEGYYQNIREDGFTEKDHVRLRDTLLSIEGVRELYDSCSPSPLVDISVLE